MYCPSLPHLSVGGAGHVDAVDLDDLVAGLQPAVLRDQPVRVDLLHHDASLKERKEEIINPKLATGRVGVARYQARLPLHTRPHKLAGMAWSCTSPLI